MDGVTAPAAPAAAHCMEMRTLQACAFKVLVEALKELLTDTCMEFDEGGLKIVALDPSHVVLVCLRLDADKFEAYHCPKRMSIGVDMLNMHKLIKTIHNNDVLTLFVDAEDLNHLGIKIENVEKNTRTTYKLNLLEFEDPSLTVPPADFNSIITLPSADFQKICRDMHNLADLMEIRYVRHQLVFACKGDFCSQETVLSDSPAGSKGLYTRRGGDADGTGSGSSGGDDAEPPPPPPPALPQQDTAETSGDEIVQGVFNIKHLVLFTKCTNLCHTVDLYLKNDYPIIVQYAVASLGYVKLCLMPQSAA